MNKAKKYDYTKPIKIISYKSPRFDIIFYSFCLSLIMVVLFFLLFIKDGKFTVDFSLWKVLVSTPLIMIAYLFKQLLDELRIYPKLLMKKHSWTINELMKLTNKDQKETENIMNHVLDAAFIVDKRNEKESDK